MRQVYLDHQTATPLRPEVLEAMRPFLTEEFGAASSPHRYGLRAREALARAREQVASFIHAESPENIIFTSDGTESANLAVKGTAWANQKRGNHIVVAASEHPAVLNSVEFLAGQGFACTKVGTDAEGIIDSEAVGAALTEQTVLIAVHHVNHDVGAVQAAREIGEIASERGIAFYVDTDASVGWLPIDVTETGASLVSFSAQRIHGPKGVGILWRSRQARLTPLLHGGDQENGRRAGMENIPAIVGAGVAAELAAREEAKWGERVYELQKRLWTGLKAAIPRMHLNGPELGPRRSPANLNISFDCIEGEGLALLSDLNGIAIGAGTACVSKSLRIPATFQAMGLDARRAQSAVTLSLGKENTLDEIDHVIATLPKLVERLRSLAPDWKS